jgi:hypothetical protein
MRRLVMAIVEAKQPIHAAGHRCATLNWLCAFRRLGWDIWIIEDIRAEKCVDQNGAPCPPERSINRKAWDEFSRLFGFDGRSTLFVDGKANGSADFHSFARDADLFLNYSGRFNRLELVEDVKVKAYLDVDPGYLQVWVLAYGWSMGLPVPAVACLIADWNGLQPCHQRRTQCFSWPRSRRGPTLGAP